MNEHFMGQNGFNWWFGIIENRIDPLKTGRAQVRIFGWNTPDKSMQPTANLIWAHPITPLNNDSPSLPNEGKMVFGFFMDGNAGQYPIIMGQIPGIPDTPPNPSQGFTDPRTTSQLTNSPRPPQNVAYNSNGSGVSITEASQAQTYPSQLNEPTTARIARNENIASTAIGQKQNSTITNVPIGSGDPNSPVSVGWSEPSTPYAAKYPFDDVKQTESGHVMEFDDTPGAERIHIFHRAGSFQEYGPDGSLVSKVTKNKTDITLANSNRLVMGAENETINGKKTLLIQGDYDVTILGDVNLTVGGNLNITYTHLNLTGDATLNGTLTVSKDVIIDGVSFDGHKHGNVQTGGDESGPPIS